MSTGVVLKTGGLLRRSIPGQVLGSPSVLARGKKQQAAKAKTAKREVMKEYVRQMELKQVTEEAAMRAARHGEPMDPEMLNPARKRAPVEVSPEEQERRYLLVKEYSRYHMERHKRELGLLQGVMAARRRALLELRKISLPLYGQALELSQDLFPFSHSGPTTTPPIPGYIPPDLDE
ncbi:39S ribosomal protein L40, mitochondrial [Geodia barretti]|uniref:Large ribosomal subunit protein mL40 n=1 Tax=Geodia barretti TaxID=519541 RepID=A0AA35TF17_GEOBA|nr:39S ribosomal protein L40, mitochondrial [Geodia barretti]